MSFFVFGELTRENHEAIVAPAHNLERELQKKIREKWRGIHQKAPFHGYTTSLSMAWISSPESHRVLLSDEYTNFPAMGFPPLPCSAFQNGNSGSIRKYESNSLLWRLSSSAKSTSWSRSPWRMPINCTSEEGASTEIRSIMRMLGILGTNTSPPCMRLMQSDTNRTPCSNVIQNLVMRSSVTVIFPLFACFMNKGTTLPLLPTTLPYRATLNFVLRFSPTYTFACTKRRSPHSLVAPYRFTGFTALSELIKITFSTLLSMAASTTFADPITLV